MLSKRKEKTAIELGFYFSFFLFEKYHILLEKQND
jgi:hypothetical protein